MGTRRRTDDLPVSILPERDSFKPSSSQKHAVNRLAFRYRVGGFFVLDSEKVGPEWDWRTLHKKSTHSEMP